jgi:hypothetical protein
MILRLLSRGDDLVISIAKPSVVMDSETFTQKESVLRLRETLSRSDADIRHGRLHSVEETAEAMKRVIAEAADAGK